MPTPTYRALANITLGSSASSVTFSSIPATYRDLILVVNGEFTTNAQTGVRFNSDSAANYPQVMMRTIDSTAESGVDTGTSLYSSWSASSSANRFTMVFQVLDYSATDKHKTALWRNGYIDVAARTRVEAFAGRWASTSAVTSLNVFTSTNGFASGFTFNLFGIAS
jgi:hypothetical protein